MGKIIKYILLISFVFAGVFYFAYHKNVNKPLQKEYSSVVFSIEKGEGVSNISSRLFEEKIISSPSYFRIYLWKNHLDKSLQAGDYVLSPSLNIREIVDIFVNGNVLSAEKDIKIIEGWDLDEIAENFQKNNIANSEDVLSFLKKPVSKWPYDFNKPDFLNEVPAGYDIEGYIYPDTYRVYNNATISDIVKKALENFDKKITPKMREDIKNQGRSLYDVLTLASIIEKEVRSDDDKKLVSGILLKRMDIGMRLEVDSTINYITGKKTPGASLSDLDIDSPYNTYKYYGLPPGPICNPGISSIEAAIYPEESNYLFYLNRQDTFETIFSEDYAEHLKNKSKYLN